MIICRKYDSTHSKINLLGIVLHKIYLFFLLPRILLVAQKVMIIKPVIVNYRVKDTQLKNKILSNAGVNFIHTTNHIHIETCQKKTPILPT